MAERKINFVVEQVHGRHASENTKYHAIYGYYVMKKTVGELATLYGKHASTIYKWIHEFEEKGSFSHPSYDRSKKFGEKEVEWLRRLYVNTDPTFYLDEAQHRFQQHFSMEISKSTICRVLQKIGFSRKVMEKRAIQIKNTEIEFYCSELQSLDWDLFNILFLDEVSFDNRDMGRSMGYSPIGERIIARGNHVRQTRISLLCFMGVGGLLETFSTDGTFTRKIFFEACREFALSGRVNQYPGKNSIWILDGARIHVDPNMVRYFRSLGIIFVFLPGYCPHMNPIEILFGLIKQMFKRYYFSMNHDGLRVFVLKIMMKFTNFNAIKLFKKCGYYPGGRFEAKLEPVQ